MVSRWVLLVILGSMFLGTAQADDGGILAVPDTSPVIPGRCYGLVDENGHQGCAGIYVGTEALVVTIPITPTFGIFVGVPYP